LGSRLRTNRYRLHGRDAVNIAEKTTPELA
jgi:hypothetical protein